MPSIASGEGKQGAGSCQKRFIVVKRDERMAVMYGNGCNCDDARRREFLARSVKTRRIDDGAAFVGQFHVSSPWTSWTFSVAKKAKFLALLQFY